MQHLETLWKVINAASTVRDMAIENKIYQFHVADPVTFYMHVDVAEVSILRWHRREINVQVQLQAGFGWRVETDQDAAGVYLVAKRRAVVGGIAQGRFYVSLPYDTYVVLKLDEGQLKLNNVSGTMNLPPPETTRDIIIKNS